MVAAIQRNAQLKERLGRAIEDASENTLDATVHLLEIVQGRGVRSAYAARALTALANLVEAADEDALIRATGAPSDYALLVQSLDRPEVVDRLRERDPLAAARIRGLRARERMLAAEGGTYTVAEVAQILGMTRQAVDKRRAAGKLIGLELGRQRRVYPAWQFDLGGVVAGLEPVLADLGRHDPWMKVAFFLSTHTTLDAETPLTVLRRGDVARVRAVARLYGEQTAL